jgi:prepilin-type N-terminal cleavage/methylation domain-containing protein
MRRRKAPSRPTGAARRTMRQRLSPSRAQAGDENGFTLIELIVVVAIMPIIVGAMVAALLSVISFTPGIENRLSDSADAQVVSTSFNKDVQGATQVTTSATVTNPSPCGSGTQILGLQYSGGAEVSYSLVTVRTGPTSVLNLYRYEGQVTAGACTLNSSTLVSHDVVNQATGSGPPSAIVTCANTTPIPPACLGNPLPYETSWVSVAGVESISLPFTYVASNYKQTLYAVPSSGVNATGGGQVGAPDYSCGFATPNTGTYASTLCFLDFTGWNTHLGTAPCGSGGQQITDGISGTPFTISFCLSTTGGAIVAAAIPTYTDPASAAYLGNGGFYTGIPGYPALYQNVEGTTSTITITNIQVFGTGGVAATNWNLVTGDAESTDSGESLTWTAGWSAGSPIAAASQVFSLIDNSPTSAIGNACANSTAGSGLTPGNGLTGVGSATVECQASVSSVKTGTAMLSAPAPTSLTANLVGTGLEAIFLGILLPSS